MVFPSCRDLLDLTDKIIFLCLYWFLLCSVLNHYLLSVEFLEGKQNTSSLPLQSVCYFHLCLNASGSWGWVPALRLFTYYCMLYVVLRKACVELRLDIGAFPPFFVLDRVSQSGAFWFSKLAGQQAPRTPLSLLPSTGDTGACYCD